MERILVAATWYKDLPTPYHGVSNIDKGIVLCGHNHAQILHQVLALTSKRQSESGEYVQGFLTNKNRFVDREEAMNIAIIANQVVQEKCTSKTDLFSEDLNYQL